MSPALTPCANIFQCRSCISPAFRWTFARCLTADHRNRLSSFFLPSGGIAQNDDKGPEDIHSLLSRAGYLRQAHSGIFHYLPLGLRVHEKVERLIDKHMRSLGASKLALSSISSEKLWKKSGRMGGTELFTFRDRKGTKYLLSPTHEEEITALIASLVGSHKQLPLRVYQISRKYRDERRPRAGLLRGREFTMKDLYTFDATESAALDTYADVQEAYKALFSDLKLPYLVAEADSGNMGGSLSHEYLYPSSTGEDTVISCTDCNYIANLEAAIARPRQADHKIRNTNDTAIQHYVSSDRKTLINVYYLRSSATATGTAEANEINPHRVRDVFPMLDPSVGNPLALFEEHFTAYTSTSKPDTYSQIVNLFDSALPHSVAEASFSNHTDHAAVSSFIADKRIPTTSILTHPSTGDRLSLLRARSDDHCPRCSFGKLKSTTAIELGHTFHLGTRYTEPLGAKVFNAEQERVTMQQGCHGLGVSRMIPAIAEGYRDERGLGWPRVMAPFEVCIIPHGDKVRDGELVYDALSGSATDTVLDDRGRDFVWKMKDADLIGYPIICVVGKAWEDGAKVEVQCRRKGLKEEVKAEEVRSVVESLLDDL